MVRLTKEDIEVLDTELARGKRSVYKSWKKFASEHRNFCVDFPERVVVVSRLAEKRRNKKIRSNKMRKVCPKCKSDTSLNLIRRGVMVCVYCGKMFYTKDLLEVFE